jgi:hypothetical protein
VTFNQKYPFTFAFILNFLIPGSAHFLYGERLFGIFILLIMLLEVVLSLVTLLVPIPTALIVILLGLPLVFFFFSFVDLKKTVQKKTQPRSLGNRTALIALCVGILLQVMVPIAPGNFILRNCPHIKTIPNNHLEPILKKGNPMIISRCSYILNIPFTNRTLMYSIPKRGDIISFIASDSLSETGIVVGLPGEEISIQKGELNVNGWPCDWQLPTRVASGELPLTSVEEYSILVAVFQFGSVAKGIQVPLNNVAGKVKRLF